MPGITEVITWEGEAFLFLFFGAVVVQLLTGQINLTGLLIKKEGDRSFSPERVQLLLATLAVASQYLLQVLKDPTQLPQVPNSWLLLYGGSHALYLGRRLYLSQFSKQEGS